MTCATDVSPYEGATAEVTFSFLDPGTRAPIAVGEPVEAKFRFESDDDATIFTVAKVSTGIYRGTFVVPTAGRYAVWCKTAGSEPAVAWGEVIVRPAPI